MALTVACCPFGWPRWAITKEAIVREKTNDHNSTAEINSVSYLFSNCCFWWFAPRNQTLIHNNICRRLTTVSKITSYKKIGKMHKSRHHLHCWKMFCARSARLYNSVEGEVFIFIVFFRLVHNGVHYSITMCLSYLFLFIPQPPLTFPIHTAVVFWAEHSLSLLRLTTWQYHCHHHHHH